MVGRWSCSLEVDILALGLPCVDLSSLNPTPAQIFGSNGGQTASGFAALKRYVRKNRPRVVLLENSDRMYARVKQNNYKPAVDNLVQFANGQGYTVAHGIQNACDYGLPQNRSRCYMIWILAQECQASDISIMNVMNGFKCLPLPLEKVACDMPSQFRKGCNRDSEGRCGEKWRESFETESSKLGKVPDSAKTLIMQKLELNLFHSQLFPSTSFHDHHPVI